MSSEENKPVVNQLLHEPEAFKEALELLEKEMNQFKKGIVSGDLAMDAPTAVLFQEAIADLSNPALATVEDIEFHTEKLSKARRDLLQDKGVDDRGNTNDERDQASD